ncbi:MAG TPA: type II toxin-antitoxin system death-on-curing family toxin [Candidatus Limnocylindrales bacterium]|nr:type II toxin-antitoxin system death-on-curing family toxin [Candidatus Limnocylindrales bacterium]HZM09514.1 type II toxin-antitoxin system death-on-curing family toxin [Candidatus Limnocylindrales bacterium]
MKRLRWLTAKAVLAIHEELIVRYGGVSGLRDDGLLESAVARPQNLVAYGQKISVASLSAAYAWGLLRNHPFVDGNKRTALAAMVVFLELNGWELGCSEAEETAMVLRAAAGEITERAWTEWVRRSTKKKS